MGTRLLCRFAVLLGLAAVFAGSSAAAAPKKPADHHGYRWGTQKLLCTSVRSERRPNDNVTIVAAGKRYWCSKPVIPAGSTGEAGMALRRAATARFYPGDTRPWSSWTHFDCTGGKGVYHCSFGEGFSGTATVTWSAKGPAVKFTSVSCAGAPKLLEVRPEGCVLP